MLGAQVDRACITDPISIAYLTGFRADPHERLMALVVAADQALLLLPDLERESAERIASEVTLLPWQDGVDPYRLLRDALGQPRRLGLEKAHLTLERWELLDASDYVDCGEAVRGMREVKQAHELQLMQRAAELTDQVTEAILAELRAGMTEKEVAARVDAMTAESGADLAFPTICQSGPNTALPHLRPSSRALTAGDLVLLDFGARHQGYNGDTTRTVVIGEPSARQLEVHAAVLRGHDAALAAIRDGMTCGEVDAAARSAIEAAGFGQYFIHRTGHGLGLEPHEGPNLTPGSEQRLAAGNVVTVEPGVYIPGWGGIRIEDDVVVESNGGRSLTASDRGLLSIR
jgi:Xaa-Pro dipeptidase